LVGNVAVFAIYGVRVGQGAHWNGLEQLFVLLEEGPAEIVALTKAHGIPLVAPPIVSIHNVNFGIWMIHADDLLIMARSHALSLVESALVSGNHSANSPTVRTKSWWRNLYALIKLKVFGLDGE